jgi:purine-binding chemotaxis protein CheW
VSANGTQSSTAARQLTVMVGDQMHALAADKVVEVIRRPTATRVPHGPPALTGVCNLRGVVLPLVSLARLMGKDAGAEQRVVVLDHGGPVGLLVDAVQRFGDIEQSDALHQVDFGKLLDAGFKRAVSSGPTLRRVGNAPRAAAGRAATRVLVSFLVNAQSFALPLTAVVEVLRMPGEIARVSHSHPAALGVASVRDTLLPIFSLAGLLGFADPKTDRSGDRVLVVEHEQSRIGLVVDSIASIVRLDEADIDKVPAVLQRGSGEAELDAIGRPGGGKPLISILSARKLFANELVEEAVSSRSQEKQAMDVGQDALGKQEQIVVFDLGEERYGLPIAAVEEVLRLPDTITRVPNAPRFVTGIINLRGRPVPIIDQRQRFDAPPAGEAVQPRVIIISVGRLQAGFVVDAVSEIRSIASADLIAAPSLSSELSPVFQRVANIQEDDGRLILLIDPEQLLSRAEQDVMASIIARPLPAGPA